MAIPLCGWHAGDSKRLARGAIVREGMEAAREAVEGARAMVLGDRRRACSMCVCEHVCVAVSALERRGSSDAATCVGWSMRDGLRMRVRTCESAAREIAAL